MECPDRRASNRHGQDTHDHEMNHSIAYTLPTKMDEPEPDDPGPELWLERPATDPRSEPEKWRGQLADLDELNPRACAGKWNDTNLKLF